MEVNLSPENRRLIVYLCNEIKKINNGVDSPSKKQNYEIQHSQGSVLYYEDSTVDSTFVSVDFGYVASLKMFWVGSDN